MEYCRVPQNYFFKNHKWNIFTKRCVFDISKIAIFWIVMSKIEWDFLGASKILLYCEGKKNCPNLFCSNFMSFCPIELIFTGWIGETWEFFRVPRNFDFKPTNGIFSQKGECPFFQKCSFLRVWCRKLSLNKIGFVDMSYIIDSGLNELYTTFPNIFSSISAESADLSHNPKNHFFKKKHLFLDRKSALEKSNLTQ